MHKTLSLVYSKHSVNLFLFFYYYKSLNMICSSYTGIDYKLDKMAF